MTLTLEELAAAEGGRPILGPPMEALSVAAEPLRLNIGGGKCEIGGYVNVDRIHGREAYPLDYPDNSAEEVYASHVLEHFGHRQRVDVLKDWVRVLKPGGRIRIAVPDLVWWATKFLEQDPRYPYEGYLYGDQEDDNGFHKSGFDERGLEKLMLEAGLVAIEKFKPFVNDCSTLEVSLNLQGYKPTKTALLAAERRKICAVMSVGRLCFADNMHCALVAFTELGINFQKFSGAFWDACLTRCIEDAIAVGAEWILTLDYDTVFTADDIRRLAMLMDMHPEADAIAPLQSMRGNTNILLQLDGPAELTKFDKEMCKAKTAHFGLTLLRVEALKRLAKPWFLGEPGKEKDWGSDRTDPDIYFWNNWRACGNTLYIAGPIPVGHMQLMVSWPDENLRPIHQHVSDYNENGKPPAARR